MSLGESLDRLVAVFDPQTALRRQHARLRLSMSSSMYRGGDSTNRLMADWALGGIGKKPTPSAYELRTLRDRCRDLTRNNAIAVGAQDTMAQNVVGQGLKLQSRIRGADLGMNDDAARELRRRVESVWGLWTPGAGADNLSSFDDLQFQTLLKMADDGEVFAVPGWASEPWREISRVIELVEGDRVGTAPGTQGQNVDNGIEYGARGQATAYWFERGPQATGRERQVRIEAFDAKGRPRVLHLFRPRRPGQRRGVPLLAPLVELFKHMGDYMEAELVAARVAACMGVFVTKLDDPLGAAENESDSTQPNSGQRVQTLEPGGVAYLRAGEDIKMVDPKRPGDAFAPYVQSMLRFISMGLGMPYELVVKDFSQTNYSSARAALLEARRMFNGWRSWLGHRLCQPVFELVLEEAWLRGQLDVPDFYANKAALCRADWVGGAWGVIEPVKEAQAAKIRIANMTSTCARECAELGSDWEDVFEQLAAERALADEKGILPQPKEAARA